MQPGGYLPGLQGGTQVAVAISNPLLHLQDSKFNRRSNRFLIYKKGSHNP
jgi:hypothetical protein